MIDYLAQAAVSNFLVSLALGAVAWGVHRLGRWPHVAHLLWMLVLAVVVTPPLILFSLESVFPLLAADHGALTGRPPLAPAAGGGIVSQAGTEATGRGSGVPVAPAVLEAAKSALVLLWAFGSLVVLGRLTLQIVRFNRLLRLAARPAPAAVQRMASAVSRQLGLSAVPDVCTISARLSPMVWWSGGPVRVVLPDGLIQTLGKEQLRCVLAHELSHVRRRDHLVRWLECLATVVAWWNPAIWWARRGLRSDEEICCDALALASLAPEPRSYAAALVTAAETLAMPSKRPVAMASGMNGGCLERRVLMIMSKRKLRRPPRWLRSALLCTSLLLPVGVTYAGDRGPEVRRSLAELGTTVTGSWRAGSSTAKTVTGDIRISNAAIVFENGERLPIQPAFPGAQNVFAVVPAADPALLNDGRLCKAPVTYVMLLSYGDFALAMHTYDGRLPPDQPTQARVSEVARKGKCASFYYHMPQ